MHSFGYRNIGPLVDDHTSEMLLLRRAYHVKLGKCVAMIVVYVKKTACT